MKSLFSIHIVAFLCLFFSTRVCFAIELGNFRCYTVENGLASNTVQDIIQDSDGYIWMVTEKSISRFDGYEFKEYICTSYDSVFQNNNYIYSLFESKDKKLWVGTEDGVCIYDLETQLFKPLHHINPKGSRIRGRIHNIFSDDNNNIWIGTVHSGAFYFNHTNDSLYQFTFEEYRNITSEPTSLTCLYRDKDNNIWASVSNSKHQIYLLDKAEMSFVPAFPDSATHSRKLRSYSILEDSFGTLWLGTWEDGLYAVDKKTRSIIGHYLNSEGIDKILHIHTITEYEPGQLLIGSNDGLTHFSTSPTNRSKVERHITEPILSSRFVYSVCKDQEGGLWIGTYYGGVNYTAPNRTVFSAYSHKDYANSISGNIVSVFCEDNKGNLWIGTDNAGLNYFNTTTGKFTHYKAENHSNSLSYDNIHALCIDENHLWIGTYTGGLNVMNLNTGKFRYYYNNPTDTTTIHNNSIYSLLKDSEGTIWVGTISGLCRYTHSDDKFERFNQTNKMVHEICQQESRIWFATNGDGLLCYELRTNKWKQYLHHTDNTESILSNNIISLCIDNKNTLWIGTGNGLCKYNSETDSFTAIHTNFPTYSISKILCDNNELWITTTKGLFCYNTTTGKTRIFTQNDGLLSDYFILNSGIRTNNGNIYIGTTKGFNVFNPRHIAKNEQSPPIGITDFQLFNRSVNMHKYSAINKDGITEICLPYNKNSFSFEYTALSYFAPEKNEYAFILEGFDKEWNEVKHLRKATYTNIPPGTYYLKIKASNNDGIWNNSGQTLKIVLVPPLWWNKWSIMLYILILITILILFMRYRLRKEESKKKEEIEKLRIKQEKETYNSKINFFTMIAHEIRTPVSLIIGPLEKIVEKADTLPANIVNDLRIIDRNSQRLLTLVNQILDFRKVEKEEIVLSFTMHNVHEVLLSIYNRFKPSIEYRNIEFIYESNEADFVTGIDVENLTKVVSNLLNNASKYTKNHIRLALSVHKQDNSFEISVSDNGPGIPFSERKKVFQSFYQIPEKHTSGTGIGLYLIKSIVDTWGGTIELDDEKEEGLRISILLPFIQVQNKEKETVLVPQKEENLPDKKEETTSNRNDDKTTILIVEDNVDMLHFLQSNLVSNYNILTAENGIEGITMLEDNEIDLIISDIMMPQMDGIEFCNKIKRSQLWNHIPLILLTAKTNVSTKIEALEIGADAYIEKPFLLSFLMAQIKNLLDSRRNLMERFSRTPYVSLKSIAGNKNDEDFLSQTNEIMEKNLANAHFTVDQLAELLHISSSGLFAKVKNLTGLTPNKLILLMRLKKSTELLLENKYRVSEICYMVGFNSPSYFAKCFQKQYGMPPKDFLQSSKKNNK